MSTPETQAATHLAQYERDGFLVLQNAIPAAELARLRAAMDELEQRVNREELPAELRQHVRLEADRAALHWLDNTPSGRAAHAISVVMELPLFAPEFARLILAPRVLDTLQELFGTTEFWFHNLKAVCKMPQSQSPFQWHRDLPYLRHTTPELITCMICLDDMTAANGATQICPGTHLGAPVPPLAADTNIPERLVPHPRVTVEAPAGSAVFFHVNVIHGGGPNQSEAPRRNLISIWGAPDSLPITAERYAYEFLRPRSGEPQYQRQIAATFSD